MPPEKTIAILQSNYIPWKGYFDIISAADEFLIFDEVQFTKNDWRNRNRIVLNAKAHWLTIPVKTAGGFGQPIDTIQVARADWAASHWATIRQAYRRSAFYPEISTALEPIYAHASSMRRLSEINHLFLDRLCGLLGIATPLLRADIVRRTTEDPTERLIEICLARGAALYISGPAAKEYLDPALFARAGVRLAYVNYGGYPVYDQGMQPFEHGVSILDVLFRFGPQARQHLKTVNGTVPFVGAPDMYDTR